MQDTEARTQALLRILLVHHLNGVDRQRLLLHQRQGARHLRSEETKDGLCWRPHQPHLGGHRPLASAAGLRAGVQADGGADWGGRGWRRRVGRSWGKVPALLVDHHHHLHHHQLHRHLLHWLHLLHPSWIHKWPLWKVDRYAGKRICSHRTFYSYGICKKLKVPVHTM